jgi:hypothetical protein
MTIGELREALAKIDSVYNDRDVKVWLPGSRISLSGWIIPSGNEHDFLIEGNVDDGSAILVQGY